MNYPILFRQLFDSDSSTYTYLLADSETKEAILIDPVDDCFERDLKLIVELELNLKYILETHVHADHITAITKFRQKLPDFQIVFGQNANVECADIQIAHGEKLEFGKQVLTAIATPGHTAGCTSYHVNDMVFTGDALMIRGCGRTDFQGGSAKQLYESVTNHLFSLADHTLLYPAHNYNGVMVSTIGEEKQWNPRLGQNKSLQEFVDTMENLNLAPPKKLAQAVPANMRCGLVSKA